HHGPLVHHNRLEALGPERREDLLAVLVALRLQVHGDGHIAHADRAAHPGVVLAGHVGIVLGDDPGNGCQRTGPVVQHHPYGHVAARGGEAALDDLEHQHRVDVPPESTTATVPGFSILPCIS